MNFKKRSFTVSLTVVFLLAVLLSGCFDESANGGKVIANAAGIDVDVAEGNITESGGQATIPLRLASKPVTDVSLHVTSSDVGEGVVINPDIVFTPENWDALQLLVVEGVDDEMADGSQGFMITLAVSSDDNNYAGLSPLNVDLSNIDDDTAGILKGAGSGWVAEDGHEAQFSLVITSQPYDNIIIHLSSSDEGEALVSPAIMTITPANWQNAHYITVTGVDDAVIDGDQSFIISFDLTSSLDAVYAAVSVGSVGMSNVDNDAPTDPGGGY